MSSHFGDLGRICAFSSSFVGLRMWYSRTLHYLLPLICVLFTLSHAHADTVVPLQFNPDLFCSFDASSTGTLVDDDGEAQAVRTVRQRIKGKLARLTARADVLEAGIAGFSSRTTAKTLRKSRKLARLRHKLVNVELALDEIEVCRDGITPVPPPARTSEECSSRNQFDADPLSGNLGNYTFHNRSHWEVNSDEGDCRLLLNTTKYDNLSGGRLGETAVLTKPSYADFTLSVRAKSAEDLRRNKAADYALVFAYRDPRNYCYTLFEKRARATAFYLVSNGRSKKLRSSTQPGITDNAYHSAEVTRNGSTLTATLDGTELLSLDDARCAYPGAIGMGSLNDSAWLCRKLPVLAKHWLWLHSYRVHGSYQ